MPDTVAVAFPHWSPHPDVWLIVALLAAGYAIAVTRLGPRLASVRPVVTRFQVVCWSLGVGAVWLASDWPIHDIAERYNYSVHMVQHLTFVMIAAPLLLLGTGMADALGAGPPGAPADGVACSRASSLR